VACFAILQPAQSENRVALLRRDLAGAGVLVGTPSGERVERLALVAKR